MLGGIEAGGTTVACVVATSPERIVREARFPTRDPAATIADAVAFFLGAAADGRRIDALGVASFGPLELRPGHPRHGWITTTPKPGWSGTDLVGPLRDALGVPVALDTDVTCAALAEGRAGAARGLDSFAYVTVGTGIGGGAVVGGAPVRGLPHPEMGRPAEELEGAALERAVAVEAHYLAAGLRNIVYAPAPRRIVLGGGVARLPGLLPAVRARLAGALGGYPGLPGQATNDFVVPAGLGAVAGVTGALLLAASARTAA